MPAPHNENRPLLSKGAGSRAGGTGCPSAPVAIAFGASVGDRPPPKGAGSRTGGTECPTAPVVVASRAALGDGPPPRGAGSWAGGTGCRAALVVVASGAPVGGGCDPPTPLGGSSWGTVFEGLCPALSMLVVSGACLCPFYHVAHGQHPRCLHLGGGAVPKGGGFGWWFGYQQGVVAQGVA